MVCGWYVEQEKDLRDSLFHKSVNEPPVLVPLLTHRPGPPGSTELWGFALCPGQL